MHIMQCIFRNLIFIFSENNKVNMMAIIIITIIILYFIIITKDTNILYYTHLYFQDVIIKNSLTLVNNKT